MGEDDYKTGLYKILDQLESETSVNRFKAFLRESIKRRIEYVKHKLSNCLGYSDLEKFARIDELNYVLCKMEEYKGGNKAS